MKLILPWPPTVNHYKGIRVIKKWSRQKHRYVYLPLFYIRKPGLEFYSRVRNIVRHTYPDHIIITDKIQIVIEAYPPDNRARDIDNVLKCTLDSLQEPKKGEKQARASVYKNDRQIKDLRIVWKRKVTGGRIVVMIRPMKTQQELF